jgi:amino acid permease
MELGLGILGSSELGGFISLFALVGILWIVVWKGWALWIAARKGSKPWFIALLVINTLGILEILYIFIFSKWKKKEMDDEFMTEAEVQEEVEKEQEENQSQ